MENVHHGCVERFLAKKMCQLCVCVCKVCAVGMALLQEARWIWSCRAQLKTLACIVFSKCCSAHVPCALGKKTKRRPDPTSSHLKNKATVCKCLVTKTLLMNSLLAGTVHFLHSLLYFHEGNCASLSLAVVLATSSGVASTRERTN